MWGVTDFCQPQLTLDRILTVCPDARHGSPPGSGSKAPPVSLKNPVAYAATDARPKSPASRSRGCDSFGTPVGWGRDQAAPASGLDVGIHRDVPDRRRVTIP